jgi:hypothetical protein
MMPTFARGRVRGGARSRSKVTAMKRLPRCVSRTVSIRRDAQLIFQTS